MFYFGWYNRNKLNWSQNRVFNYSPLGIYLPLVPFCGYPMGLINSSSSTVCNLTYSTYANVYGLSEYSFSIIHISFWEEKTGQNNQPYGKQCIIHEYMVVHAECKLNAFLIIDDYRNQVIFGHCQNI